MRTLLDMVKEYQTLLERKDELATLTKENTAAIEAAKLDDASNMKIMFKVMMPMAKPALVTIGLLSFISTWNNYFWPLIMTSSETLRTLPVGVAALKSSETLQMWNIIMAGNVVLVLPILIVYIVASKKIRNSFTYSGIK